MDMLSPALCCCRVGVNRISFLLESLTDLDDSFKARGTRLLVLKGNPLELMPKLFKVSLLSWQCQAALQCALLSSTDGCLLRQLRLMLAACQACQCSQSLNCCSWAAQEAALLLRKCSHVQQAAEQR